jgi:hypothetical protein
MASACGIGALALSGCMGSPTYGTDKTATEQLFTDVSGIMALTPPKRDPIDYKPRPELVKPVRGEAENLPVPQDNVTTASSSWPESPEQMRARLRKDAEENRDNPNWRPQIDPDVARASATSSTGRTVPHRAFDAGLDTPANAGQSAEFKRRLAENRQGSPASRKYLSEPPLTYREAAAGAPSNDLGEDEAKKERRRKAEATKKKSGSWADLWPF